MNDGDGRLGGWDEGDLAKGHLDGLDGLIDQALGSYTAREPRAGLESRVLSRIAAAEAERARRHGWSWKPAWALAAAMALTAVVAIPVWFRPVRPETAVVHSPEIHRPAVAEVRHPPQAAPLTARTARTTRTTRTTQHTFIASFPTSFTGYGRVAAAEPEVLEIAAKTSPGPMERETNAPVDDKPLTDEQATLKPAMLRPIELKPITIAPIQIGALN